MKSKQKKITILFIGLFIALNLNNTLFFNDSVQNELNIPKESAGYSELFIHVDGSDPNNWTWTAGNYSWCYFDNGYYIIENVTINANSSPTGSGILINNSLDVYFIIRNCTVYNAGSDIYDAGIRLQNTCNGTIIDNTCTNNGNNGITLYSSSNNNTLSGNTANNNTLHGIYLYNNCDFNNIINNKANDNTDQGIYLETGCDSNNITDNIINDNNLHGIYLDYNCDFNNIINNTANYNTGHGIFLSNSDYSNITDNTINGNIQSGIYLLGFD
ncbi:MAG: right-handed parallel beta-helix repeat-containing protein, partial [Candidatus Lokiarchaeota archaeon]|nr:right-handed parallel beta-helix repeat-containing protein [Candidatus Lokiarchaeota archaeon]